MALIEDTKAIYDFIESKKLLVFDFDGVLADSVEIKTNAFSEIYKPFGVSVVKKVVDHHRNNGGMARFDKFKYYHSTYLGLQLSDYQLSILSEQFSGLVVNAVIASSEVPGADNFIRNFCLGNKKCIINSATPHKEIYKIINNRGMNKYFNDIYGSPTSKSNNLKLALKKNELRAKDVVFFGDSMSDFQAAKNLKIDFVGVGKIMYDLLINLDEYYYFINDFLNLIDESTD